MVRMAAAGSRSAPGSILWTPAHIETSLWLDASDSTTITLTSGAVSQWRDKSGNDRHFGQATAANRPTIASAAINSRDVVRFDGSNDWMAAASAILGVTHSIYVVFKPVLKASPCALLSQYAVSQTGRMIMMCNQTCAGSATAAGRINPFNASITSGACGGAGAGLLNDVVITATTTLIEWLQTTGSENSVVYRNGTLQDSGTATAIYTGANTTLGRAVGAGTGGTDAPYDGDVAEVVLRAAKDSDTDRQRMEGYLAWKWGFQGSLPGGHPYASAPPTIN